MNKSTITVHKFLFDFRIYGIITYHLSYQAKIERRLAVLGFTLCTRIETINSFIVQSITNA